VTIVTRLLRGFIVEVLQIPIEQTCRPSLAIRSRIFARYRCQFFRQRAPRSSYDLTERATIGNLQSFVLGMTQHGK